MNNPQALDLTRLPEYLDKVEADSPHSAALLRTLLDSGADILQFVGPVQMGVWWLELRAGDVAVAGTFERGFFDGVSVGRNRALHVDGSWPIGWLVMARSKATHAPLEWRGWDALWDPYLRDALPALDWFRDSVDLDLLHDIQLLAREVSTTRPNRFSHPSEAELRAFEARARARVDEFMAR